MKIRFLRALFGYPFTLDRRARPLSGRWAAFSSGKKRNWAGALLWFCVITIYTMLPAPAALAQTLEDRYQQAVNVYNKGEMEDACTQFQQIQNESPGFKDTSSFLKTACNEKNRMYDMEEKRFHDGENLFNQGKLDEAREKFESAGKIRLKNPKYKAQIAHYIAEIDSRQIEERNFERAVALFNQKKYQEARDLFNQINGAKASVARDYLAKIAELLKPPRVEPAPKPPTPKPVTPTPPTPTPPVPTLADDGLLRQGLQDYFEGKTQEAEQALSDYLKQNGQKKEGLAYFFLGAAYGDGYFLSGEKDLHLRDMAVADFRSVRDHSPQFHPPAKYISPKILALYSDAAGLSTK